MKSFFFKQLSAFIALLIGASLFATNAAPVHASLPIVSNVPVGDVLNNPSHTFNMIKEELLDGLVNIAAKAAIKQLTRQMVNFITGANDGNPTFITNPVEFLVGLQEKAFDDFTNHTLNNVPEILKNDLINLISTDFSSSFENFARGTLPPGLEDPNSGEYERALESGGWDEWITITQNPYNNAYGLFLKSRAELQKRIASVQSTELIKANWFDGWLSLTDENGNITTPGGMIEDQLTNVLGSGVRQLELADEFNEIISALASVVIDEITKSGEGFFKIQEQATCNVQDCETGLDRITTATNYDPGNNTSGLQTAEGASVDVGRPLQQYDGYNDDVDARVPSPNNFPSTADKYCFDIAGRSSCFGSGNSAPNQQQLARNRCQDAYNRIRDRMVYLASSQRIEFEYQCYRNPGDGTNEPSRTAPPRNSSPRYSSPDEDRDAFCFDIGSKSACYQTRNLCHNVFDDIADTNSGLLENQRVQIDRYPDLGQGKCYDTKELREIAEEEARAAAEAAESTN